MRKQDYQLLAEKIREALLETATVSNPQVREFALSMVSDIAKDFADGASVDKSAFLRACGLK